MNSEPLADVIARMQRRLTPGNAPTMRKATDMPPPNGVANGYGTRRNTNANRRNGGGSCYYQPSAADFAGALPATTRPSAPAVKPVTGTRITGATTADDARVIGIDNNYRSWVSARTNIARDAGDVLPPSEHYPHTITPRGNLGCSPRY